MRNTAIFVYYRGKMSAKAEKVKKKIRLYAQLERLISNSMSEDCIHEKNVLKKSIRMYSGMTFGGRNR